MGFDAIAQPAVAASADLDPWDSRPLVGNSDGALGNGPNNSQYKWSSTVGEWVRAWVWDLQATFVLDNKIDGDVVPSSEPEAWTQVTSSGTITSDGTHVSFTTTGAVSHTAYCSYIHDQSDKNHFMIGNITVTSITGLGTGGCPRFEVRTDGRDINLDPAGIKGSENVIFLDMSGTTSEIGQRIANVTLATEKWVEVYVHQQGGLDGIATCYVAHSLRPVTIAAGSLFNAHSGKIYYIGDATSNASCLMKVRNIKVGRWT